MFFQAQGLGDYFVNFAVYTLQLSSGIIQGLVQQHLEKRFALGYSATVKQGKPNCVFQMLWCISLEGPCIWASAVDSTRSSVKI